MSETLGTGRRKISRVAGCLVALLAITAMAGLVMCTVAGLSIAGFMNSCDRAFAENVASFTFPSSATHLTCSGYAMQGRAIHARFDMDPNDLDTLLASTRVESVEDQPIPEDVHFTYNQWGVRKHLYGEYRSTYFNQYILIDTSSEDVYTVYFEYIGGD